MSVFLRPTVAMDQKYCRCKSLLTLGDMKIDRCTILSQSRKTDILNLWCNAILLLIPIKSLPRIWSFRRTRVCINPMPVTRRFFAQTAHARGELAWHGNDSKWHVRMPWSHAVTCLSVRVRAESFFLWHARSCHPWHARFLYSPGRSHMLNDGFIETQSSSSYIFLLSNSG